MNLYFYNNEVYCESCIRHIEKILRVQGKRPSDPLSDWPNGPYPSKETEFGFPQHCMCGASCLDPSVWSDGRKSGKFLENRLTIEGEQHVQEMHSQEPSEVTQFWMDYYGIGRR